MKNFLFLTKELFFFASRKQKKNESLQKNKFYFQMYPHT